jgi:membrane protease YdiL (CAAX protease family)
MPDPVVGRKKDHPPLMLLLLRAATVAAGMCLFALFMHTRFPSKLFSICGLCVVLFILYLEIKAVSLPAVLFGFKKFSKSELLPTACGIVLGAVLGLGYRLGYGMKPLIEVIGWFAPVAVMIGATEEILFRGYIQGRVQSLGPFWAVSIAAFCHTAYKCSLFVFHDQPVQINMLFLAVCTFGVGLMLGVLRQWRGSIWPPVTAHVLFDILAYGEYAHAPWWVWS